MPASDLVVLVGNGLSIAVNPELRLDRLTEAFLRRHGEDRQDLDRLLAEVNLGGLNPTEDFEGIIAGLEATEEVLTAFMRLAARSSHPDLNTAAEILRAGGVPHLVRRLYFAYCAEILDAIGEGARTDLPEEVRSFGAWLKLMYLAHQRMGIFTMNYDVLLERLLVNDDLLGLGDEVTDYFSGRDSRTEGVKLAAGGEVLLGRYFYPEDPPLRTIHLHHLHGCLTHFRRESDGATLKFDAAALRQDHTYQHLADSEAGDFSPSVILGSRKVSKAREWPFSFAFLELERRAFAARTVVIAGYSFRDEAVNVRLQAAAQGGKRRWIVVNRKTAAEADAFCEKVNALLSSGRPEFALDGLGVDLPADA